MIRRSLAAASLLVLVTACSSGDTSSAAPSSASGVTDGDITVFAAASLTNAFDDAKAKLAVSNPGLTIAYSFAGSNALATQIQQGAPADVFASADAKNMQQLVDAGLVETPKVFARNRLEIAVAPGNPKGITGLDDLGRRGVDIVLGAEGVPAGDYARQVLTSKGIKVDPRSLETDVKSALAKVTSGEADATIVYVTDVIAAGATVQGVELPEADQPAIAYPIAVVRATKQHAGADAFVESAVSGVVHSSLEAAGFAAP